MIGFGAVSKWRKEIKMELFSAISLKICLFEAAKSSFIFPVAVFLHSRVCLEPNRDENIGRKLKLDLLLKNTIAEHVDQFKALSL